MTDKVKYLYYRGGTDDGIYRSKIIRETDNHFWIASNSVGEIKISKKTHKIGSGWQSTFYYEETPELYREWTLDNLRRRFMAKLESLRKCNDVEIMEQVIAIPFEEK